MHGDRPQEFMVDLPKFFKLKNQGIQLRLLLIDRGFNLVYWEVGFSHLLWLNLVLNFDWRGRGFALGVQHELGGCVDRGRGRDVLVVHWVVVVALVLWSIQVTPGLGLLNIMQKWELPELNFLHLNVPKGLRHSCASGWPVLDLNVRQTVQTRRSHILLQHRCIKVRTIASQQIDLAHLVVPHIFILYVEVELLNRLLWLIHSWQSWLAFIRRCRKSLFVERGLNTWHHFWKFVTIIED